MIKIEYKKRREVPEINIYDSIFSLPENEVFVGDFAAVRKEIIPPAHFKCHKNLVLYQRFVYVVKGTFIFNDEVHKNVRFEPGDIIYLPSDVVYESYWEKDEIGEFISLNFCLYDPMYNNINLFDDLVLACKDPDRKLFSVFDEVQEIWNKSARGHKLQCISHLYALLYRIGKYSLRLEEGSKNAISKAVIYLENHFLNDVTVEDLVKLTNVGECQFRRSFKALKGMSPIKYRNMLRMTKAIDLLKTGEYSVVEASMIVGFDDPSYFSKLFKKQFGQSPSSYIPQ